MQTRAISECSTAIQLPDEDVIQRVRNGETALYEIIMRRYNRRLYRVACAILRDESEAEDVMQEAYVCAYSHLDQFAGKASFATWLTKIAIYEALARMRRRARLAELDPASCEERWLAPPLCDPERQVWNAEMQKLLEDAIAALPPSYRVVFVLREIEELSTSKTAACLGLEEQTVRTRVHRARLLLRRRLQTRVDAATRYAYYFHLIKCDRVVRGVLTRLAAPQTA